MHVNYFRKAKEIICNNYSSNSNINKYMGVGRGRGHAHPPWIFIHGTDIVDRGLIVLFSNFFAIFRSFFFRWPPGRSLIVLFFGLFSFLELPLLGNFSADAFE